METIKYLYLNADLRKTTGYDFIPYKALAYPQFRDILLRDLRKLIVSGQDTDPFFQAKLTLFNKNKSGTTPLVN